MRAVAVWSGAFYCALVAHAARADEGALRWVLRLDDAKAIAAAEHKDLFVNFTGLEWCGHCIDLDSCVLSRKEFSAAANDFVLVDLDFPSDRDELGESKDAYNGWMKQYLIHGFPTVVLADASGKPYAFFTGYDDEVDVAMFMKQLAGARQARQARDSELAAAKQASGADRARKLHAAIQAVAEALGPLEDREDDAVLAFYQEEVDEIRRLDGDNALKLRKVYDARIRARDEYRRREAILADLVKFKTKEDVPAAIAHIDKLLSEIDDPRLQFRLKQRQCSFLQWNEQHAEALDMWRRLVQDPDCPADDRNWMLRNVAIGLYRLGRVDEALAFYDEQIAATKDQSDRLYFLSWKASMLLGSGRHDEAIATCRAYRAATKPNSAKWMEATGYLAWALQLAGQHREMITVSQEQLTRSREIGGGGTHILLKIARSQHAMGLDEEARQTLDEAEKEMPSQADRPAKQKANDRTRRLLQETRQSFAPKAK